MAAQAAARDGGAAGALVLDEVDDASDALKQLETTKDQGEEAPSDEEGEDE